MKRVLLFDTAIATTNLGDEIILESVKAGLKPVLYDALTFRLGTHIENYSPLQMGKSNWKYYELCEKANYKFICGTNLLSENLKMMFPQWMLNPFNVKLYSDSVLVGVGKISDFSEVNSYTKKLYNRCLSKKYMHSVRDEDTKHALEKMGYKAINTGCPTLWMLTPERCAMIPSQKAENAIISVSGYADQANPKQDQKMIDCVLKNYKKVYAWIQTIADKAYLDSLLRTDKIECIYSLEKYEDILKCGNIDYIGTRLHGGVYALQHFCRTIVVSIDRRAEGFHESNNLTIIKRNEIEEKLDGMINSDWKTEIRIDQEAIEKFIKQF